MLPSCRQSRKSRLAEGTSIALYAAIERRHLSVFATDRVDLMQDQKVVRIKSLTTDSAVRVVQMTSVNYGRITIKSLLSFIP